jgi:NADPH:quinone reductase-like Zn-dependent oxidoreductase
VRWLQTPTKAWVELIEAGTVVPVIDKRFTLAETADAFRYFLEGTFTGKIVITM